MKKFFSFFVVAFLLIGTLSGCFFSSESSSQPFPSQLNTDSKVESSLEEETVALSWMLPVFDVSPSMDMPVIKKFAENTNTTLSFDCIGTDDYQTKLNLMVTAKDDMPDIISTSVDFARQYGKSIFVNLNDYRDELHDYFDWLTEVKGEKQITMDDGAIYNAVRIDYPSDLWFGLFARIDVLEKLNLEIPETLDEFTNILYKLKEEYPESVPMTHRMGHGFLMECWTRWFSTRTTAYFDHEKEEYLYGPVTSQYRSCVEYLRMLYSEGLLDQEYAVNTSEQFYAKLYTGKSFVASDYFGMDANCNTNGVANDPNYKMQAIPLPKVDGKRGTTKVGDNIMSDDTLVISNQSKYIDRVIRMIAYMYSEEGVDLMSWGIEGETYESDGADGYRRTENIITAINPNGSVTEREVGCRINGLTRIFPLDVEKALWDENLKVGKQRYYDLNLGEPVSPTLYYTEEQNKEISDINSALSTYVDEEVVKFITGTRPMEEYDVFLQKLEEMNYKRILEIRNEVYTQQYSE